MDRNAWLLTQNADELIRQRVSARRSQLPDDVPRPPRAPRRHQVATTLRRIADRLDN